MKEFGLQIYSVRDRTTDAEGIRATFKTLKEMGYSSIQTAGTPAVSYEEYGKMAAEAGFRIVGTHDNFKMMCEDFDEKRGHQMFDEIGQGNLEWELILEAAEKAGVKYNDVEQDTCDGDSLDSMRISADHLKTMIK